MREMQVFWKKNEKEERDVRKREQKEASDRLKVEEEKREAARQARKLEFLISQTELYSHFVGNKLKSKHFHHLLVCSAETATATDIEGDGEKVESHLAPIHDLELIDPTTLEEINFDDGRCFPSLPLNFLLIILTFQRIRQTFTDMPCTMRRRPSPLPNNERKRLMCKLP